MHVINAASTGQAPKRALSPDWEIALEDDLAAYSTAACAYAEVAKANPLRDRRTKRGEIMFNVYSCREDFTTRTEERTHNEHATVYGYANPALDEFFAAAAVA